LLAEASVINLSRSLGISEAKLHNKAGKLLASASATCMLFST